MAHDTIVRRAPARARRVHRRVDTRGEDLELRYFRDIDGREVDLVVTDRPFPITT